MRKLTQSARTLIKKGVKELSDEMLKKLFDLVLTERVLRGHKLEHSIVDIEVEEVSVDPEAPEFDDDVMTLWHSRFDKDEYTD